MTARTRPIRLYWWGGHDGSVNFGDAVSPLIVEMVSGRKVDYAEPQSADIAAIGSILHKVNADSRMRPFHGRLSRIHIWGTGTKKDIPLRAPFLCHFAAVRGPKTRALAGADGSLALGDPGLLVAQLLASRQIPKTARVGIIPHFVDKQHPGVKLLEENFPGATVIDVENPDLKDFIRQVASCECIVSSSLHGLITADAFSIPRIRVRFTGKISGGDFKFSDYFATVGTQTIPASTAEEIVAARLDSLLETAAEDRVEKICNGLVAAFRTTGL